MANKSIAIKDNLFFVNYEGAFRLLLLNYMTHILATFIFTINFYFFDDFFHLGFCFLDLLAKSEFDFGRIVGFVFFFQSLIIYLFLLLLLIVLDNLVISIGSSFLVILDYLYFISFREKPLSHFPDKL